MQSCSLMGPAPSLSAQHPPPPRTWASLTHRWALLTAKDCQPSSGDEKENTERRHSCVETELPQCSAPCQHRDLSIPLKATSTPKLYSAQVPFGVIGLRLLHALPALRINLGAPKHHPHKEWRKTEQLPGYLWKDAWGNYICRGLSSLMHSMSICVMNQWLK